MCFFCIFLNKFLNPQRSPCSSMVIIAVQGREESFFLLGSLYEIVDCIHFKVKFIFLSKCFNGPFGKAHQIIHVVNSSRDRG